MPLMYTLNQFFATNHPYNSTSNELDIKKIDTTNFNMVH